MIFDDDVLEGAVREFKDESLELLESMENSLLDIQENGFEDDTINAVFRAAHTIKGSAGMLKLQNLVEFTHIAENILDDVRNHKIVLGDDLIDVFLKCKDHMEILVGFYSDNTGKEPEGDIVDEGEQLLAELKKVSNKEMPESNESEQVFQEEAPKSSGNRTYEVSVDFGESIFEDGMDPANFLRYLEKLGKINTLETQFEKIGDVSSLDPHQCKISCAFLFESECSVEDIEEAFDFIIDDIVLKINQLPSEGSKEESVFVEEEKKEEPKKEEVKQEKPKEKKKDSKATPEITTPKTTSSLRVDSDRIDSLINLIGEMVIANSNVVSVSSEINNERLIESVSIVSHMLEEIREGAMKIRMVQIGETFGKFKRIVRDVGKKLNKEVDLVITGGETELDKTLVEKLSDPLVHIVRNAMDHGIENSDERIANNKSPKGVLKLNAFHDAGTIAIEITDDGKGLDEEVLLQKGIDKGLVEPDAKLTKKEIFSLILEPGFSTASEVTDISGRGVGMDVVRKNVQLLRGSIDIDSEQGVGSTFTIRLPLTLAIIDGFQVKVGNTFYVVPLDMLVECVELPTNLEEKMNGNQYINLRGELLPLLNLKEFFDETSRERSSEEKENVMVVKYAGKRYGFIVDELFGEFQTVIKPLGKVFRGIKGIGGATILGSGDVALILDVPVLVNYVLNSNN